MEYHAKNVLSLAQEKFDEILKGNGEEDIQVYDSLEELLDDFLGEFLQDRDSVSLYKIIKGMCLDGENYLQGILDRDDVYQVKVDGGHIKYVYSPEVDLLEFGKDRERYHMDMYLYYEMDNDAMVLEETKTNLLQIKGILPESIDVQIVHSINSENKEYPADKNYTITASFDIEGDKNDILREVEKKIGHMNVDNIKIHSDKKNSFNENILICGLHGDRRFCDEYAMLSINGEEKSINDIYRDALSYKRDENGVLMISGFECPYTGDQFRDRQDALNFYRGLWIDYFEQNPELIDYAKEFDGMIGDALPENGTLGSADILAAYVANKERYIAVNCASKWYKNKIRKCQNESLEDKIQGAKKMKQHKMTSSDKVVEKKNKVRKAVNIQWDVDEKEDLESLPSEMTIPDGMDEENISDYLSDETGFCHFGYELVEESKSLDDVIKNCENKKNEKNEDKQSRDSLSKNRRDKEL